jgi:hypothetical protein
MSLILELIPSAIFFSIYTLLSEPIEKTPLGSSLRTPVLFPCGKTDASSGLQTTTTQENTSRYSSSHQNVYNVHYVIPSSSPSPVVLPHCPSSSLNSQRNSNVNTLSSKSIEKDEREDEDEEDIFNSGRRGGGGGKKKKKRHMTIDNINTDSGVMDGTSISDYLLVSKFQYNQHLFLHNESIIYFDY